MNKSLTKGITAVLLATSIAIFLFSCESREHQTGREIHFSRKQNWTGEPAGLVYHNGKYHLFYQCNPSDIISGNIGWGHAVSTDLTRWEEHPMTFQANEDGQYYSGSVIVDRENTSGLGSREEPVFIAYYTRYNPANRVGVASPYTPGMAYSRDEGLSWTHLPLEWNETVNGLRYPNVSWNDEIQAWVMTISTGQTIRFYRSPDAIRWELIDEFSQGSETSGGWENSTLTQVKTNGPGETKWVLFINVNEGPSDGAPRTRYFIGDFNSLGFKVTQAKELWVDYGKDNYGDIVCNNLPDDRTIMIGWMNSWLYANLTPQTGKRGSMIFPRELTLAYDGNHYTLCSMPVRELIGHYGKEHKIDNTEISGHRNVFNKRLVPQSPFVLHLAFDASDRFAMWHPREYGIRLKTASGKELRLAYRAEMNYYYADRSGLAETNFSEDYARQTGAAYRVNPSVDEWTILVGQNSVEWFAGDKQVAMTSLFFADEPLETIECYTESGRIDLIEASMIEIK